MTTTGPRALALYRSLLRAHSKCLPSEMKQLGDAYVKSEFRLHKKAKTEQLGVFFQEWEKYLDSIQMAARAKQSVSVGSLGENNESSIFQFGRDLPQDVELSEEQLSQLEKLKDEAVKAGPNK
jgi:hypothetical protein